MKFKKKNPKDLSFILGCGGTAKGVGTFAGLGVLTLQSMKNPCPIGGSVKPSNLEDGTSLVYFVTEDSVSRLIAELTKMRSDMKKTRKARPKKLEIIIDATDHKPNGHSNERKRPSGTRTK